MSCSICSTSTTASSNARRSSTRCRAQPLGPHDPAGLGADAKATADRSTRIELPIWAEGLEIGRFVLVLADDATGLEFDPAARTSALALADQLGIALLAHDR